MPKEKLFDEQEVLEKAMHLFWQKGYYNTSMKDIVDHLGISRSSLYNTFKRGKKELYDKALALYRTSNDQGLGEFLAQIEDVKVGLRMIFQKIIEDDMNDEDCKGCLVVNTTTELVPEDKKSQEVVTEHKDQMEDVFYQLLKKGVDKGQISEDKDIKTIARLLYTLMSGLRVVGKTKPPLQESMASVDAVLSLL